VIADIVTVEESALLDGLREIPDGPARVELMALMNELVGYVRDPRCPQAQGDGVPCTTTVCDCEECQQVARALASLRTRVRTPEATTPLII
jgi:hypothetical protein